MKIEFGQRAGPEVLTTEWLIWRICAVLAFRRMVPGMGWREAWGYANTFGDSFREGRSPAEAVSDEISYWDEG